MKSFWPEEGPPFSSLMPFLEYLERPAGDFPILQGDESDELLFIHRGKVTAQLELQNGKMARLRSMNQGTVVGELGLYLNEPRSASIVTDEPCILYRLTRDSLQRMQREAPEVASAFHHFMTKILADRMSATTKSLQSILE
jgi:SulP family sulfate permease